MRWLLCVARWLLGLGRWLLCVARVLWSRYAPPHEHCEASSQTCASFGSAPPPLLSAAPGDPFGMIARWRPSTGCVAGVPPAAAVSNAHPHHLLPAAGAHGRLP
eukprot:365740-Chlamydomonas_euryale.AAC.1